MGSKKKILLKNCNLAILGSMGFPAAYGGTETCVQEISIRLISSLKFIWVVCGTKEPKKAKKEFKGIGLVHIKRRNNKFIDFPIRNCFGAMIAIFSGAHILHFFGAENSPYILLARLFRKKCILTLDGLHWKRKSYPKPLRFLLRLNAIFSAYIPHVVVADNKIVQKWFIDHYARHIYYIPYGAYVDTETNLAILDKYGLKKREYYIFVGRLVKEKGIEYLIDAFNDLEGSSRKLVIIGGDEYNKDYVKYLKRKARKNILFLGFVYGEEYKEISKGAYVFITPSTLEGTSPALLSAMGFGNCVLVSNIPENIETVSDAGFYFKAGGTMDLKEKIQFLDSHPQIVKTYQKKAIQRVKKHFQWDIIAKKYQKLYEELLSG